jgi:hypothetical protein
LNPTAAIDMADKDLLDAMYRTGAFGSAQHIWLSFDFLTMSAV